MKSQESPATPPSPRLSVERRKQRRGPAGPAIAENEKTTESYTRGMARWPRYRFRTWAREHLPRPLAYLFPPGDKDCGRHEWFRNDEHTDICWHCTVGEREHVPVRIDPTSELWQELNRAARAGSQSAQEIVERMIAEDKEAQRVVPA